MNESRGTDVDRLGRVRARVDVQRCSFWTTASTSSTEQPTSPEPIAEGCAHVRILATSREALGVPDERARRRHAAGSGGGRRAVQRARRGGRARPSIQTPAAATSRRSAAASTDSRSPSSWRPLARRDWRPAELVVRLDDRLRLLTGGRRGSVERHRTLRATHPVVLRPAVTAATAVFQRLSIFAGPFDLSAAEAVVADADVDRVDVDQFLGDLVDQVVAHRRVGTIRPPPPAPRDDPPARRRALRRPVAPT